MNNGSQYYILFYIKTNVFSLNYFLANVYLKSGLNPTFQVLLGNIFY